MHRFKKKTTGVKYYRDDGPTANVEEPQHSHRHLDLRPERNKGLSTKSRVYGVSLVTVRFSAYVMGKVHTGSQLPQWDPRHHRDTSHNIS